MQRSIAVGDGLSDFRRQAGWTRALKGHGPYGNITGWFPLCGPVAQGIEQRFPVPCVGGSNPSRPALRLPPKLGGFLFLPTSPALSVRAVDRLFDRLRGRNVGRETEKAQRFGLDLHPQGWPGRGGVRSQREEEIRLRQDKEGGSRQARQGYSGS